MVEKKIEKLSFEEAMQELESIVMRLEGSNTSLDDAINLYNRGNLLKKHCQQKLADSKLKIEQVIAAPDGSIILESKDFMAANL